MPEHLKSQDCETRITPFTHEVLPRHVSKDNMTDDSYCMQIGVGKCVKAKDDKPDSLPLNMSSNMTPSSFDDNSHVKSEDKICFPFCDSTNRLRNNFPKKISLQSISSIGTPSDKMNQGQKQMQLTLKKIEELIR